MASKRKRPLELADYLALFVAGGVGGWLLENLANPEPRFSWTLGGREGRVLILPIYGAGLIALAMMKPHLEKQGVIVRYFGYAGGLAALEGVAGITERALGRKSWDYEGAVVDAKHTAIWGALALAVEDFVP